MCEGACLCDDCCAKAREYSPQIIQQYGTGRPRVNGLGLIGATLPYEARLQTIEAGRRHPVLESGIDGEPTDRQPQIKGRRDLG